MFSSVKAVSDRISLMSRPIISGTGVDIIRENLLHVAILLSVHTYRLGGGLHGWDRALLAHEVNLCVKNTS